MSRARDLSKLGNPNVIKADENSVGFGTQVAGNHANADSSLLSAGIVTATAYYGDGSNLEGVASAGLGTAVDDTKDSIGQNIYFTNAELSINTNTTVNAPDTSNIAYTQYQQVTVESGSELIIADGDSFIPDVLGIGTALQASTAGAGNGLFGTVFVDNIENAAGRGGPNFPLGITVAGVSTLSGNVSIGGTLTYEDVTNVDSIGIVTARSGIKVIAGGIDVTAGAIAAGAGVNVTGGNIIIGQGGSGANNAELKLQAGAGTGNDIIAFLNQAGSTRGNITYDTDNNFVLFNVNAGEKLRIGSAGQIGIGGANYGTSGQVLSSQGASAAPQWADAGGGAWEMVSSTEFNNVLKPQVNIPTYSGFGTSLYSSHKFVIQGLRWTGGGNKEPGMRFTLNNSSSLDSSSNYWYGGFRVTEDTNGGIDQFGVNSGQDRFKPVEATDIKSLAYMEVIIPNHNIGMTMYPVYSWSECRSLNSVGKYAGYNGYGSHRAAVTNHLTGLSIFDKDNNTNVDYCRISLYRCKIT